MGDRAVQPAHQAPAAAPSPAQRPPGARGPWVRAAADALALQHAAGNRVTRRLLRTGEHGTGAAGGYGDNEKQNSQSSPGEIDSTAEGTLLWDFPVNGRFIKPRHQEHLRKLIKDLGWRRQGSLFPIKEIVGFSDAVQRQGGNAELREDRAITVQTFLETSGALPENTGVAKAAPPDRFITTNNETPEGRARNRSVLISTDALLPPEPRRGTVRFKLLVKVIAPPKFIAPEVQIANARRAFAPHFIGIDVLPIQVVPEAEAQAFRGVAVGSCDLNEDIHPDLEALHTRMRGQAGPDVIVVYLVNALAGLKPENGCARHPPGKPGAVVEADPGPWTLAHEVGHVLGLVAHAPDEDKDRLMHAPVKFDAATAPTLTPDEVETIRTSRLIRNR